MRTTLSFSALLLCVNTLLLTGCLSGSDSSSENGLVNNGKDDIPSERGGITIDSEMAQRIKDSRLGQEFPDRTAEELYAAYILAMTSTIVSEGNDNPEASSKGGASSQGAAASSGRDIGAAAFDDPTSIEEVLADLDVDSLPYFSNSQNLPGGGERSASARGLDQVSQVSNLFRYEGVTSAATVFYGGYGQEIYELPPMASALFEAGIGDHHSNPGECTLDNADDFGWKYMLDPSGRDVLRQDGPGPYLGVFQRTRSAIINCYGCENGDFSNISDSIDDHGVIRGNSTTVSFHEEEHMLPSVTGDPADIQTAINHAENVGDQNFSRVLNVPAHYHRLGGDIGDLQTYFVEQYELERRLTNGNAEAWATLEGEQVVTFEDNRFEACNMDARVNTIEPLLVKLKAPQAVTEHAQRIPIGPGKIQYDTPHGTFFVRYDANAAKELLDAGGNPINFPSVEEPTDWLEEECGDLFDPTIPIP